MLTTHGKKCLVSKHSHRQPRIWTDTLVQPEKEHDIWHLESYEPVVGRFNYSNSQGIKKIYIRFSGCAGCWVEQRGHGESKEL